MKTDHEIFSMVILLLLLIQEGLLSATSESMCMEYWLATLSKLVHGKCVVGLTDNLDMTIAVDWEVKPQNMRILKKIFRKQNIMHYYAACKDLLVAFVTNM